MKKHCNKQLDLLVLEITSRCNLKCPLCFRQEEMKGQNDLPYEDWVNAYNIYKPKIVSLFGGEPTLRWKECLKFLDYIYKENPMPEPVNIHIVTNGSVDVNWEDIPAEYRKHILVCLGIDGLPESDKVTRGEYHFEKAIKTAAELSRLNIAFCISTVYTPDFILNNTKSVEEFITYMHTNYTPINIRIHTALTGRDKIKNDMSKIMTVDDIKAARLIRSLDVVKKYNVEINERARMCKSKGVFISSNGGFSPKCTALRSHTKYGHYTEYTLEDALKIYDYILSLNFRCEDKDTRKVDKFIESTRRLRQESRAK